MPTREHWYKWTRIMRQETLPCRSSTVTRTHSEVLLWQAERERGERNVAFQDAIARAGRQAMERRGPDEDACVEDLCHELQGEELIQESAEQARNIPRGPCQQDISRYLEKR